MKKLLFVLLSAVLLLSSGCATAVLSSLHGSLPISSAKTLRVTANIAAAGGGKLEVKDLATDPVTGQVTAGEYHEIINTGGGSFTIDGENVVIKRK